MATNLVSYAMQFLTPDLIARIAAALGLDRNSTQSAVTAAVPALLAAFSGTAATPGGARGLVDTIKQQSSVLDGFAGMIGRGSQSSLIEKGSSLLTSLLGSDAQPALAGAVGKFSGLGQNGGNSILGMLTPVVLGLIGKQIGTRNLDAGSLTALLGSQKEQIAEALPAGMGKLLAGTGLLDTLGTAVESAATAAGQVGRATTAAPDRLAHYASGQRVAGSARSGMPTWIYWAVPLAVIAGLLWYLLGNRAPQMVAHQSPTSVQSVVVGGVDVGKQVADSLGNLRTSLQGITDVRSATAAISKLQETATQIDKVNGTLGHLSVDQRKLVSGLVASAMVTIDQLFDKVLAIPSAGEVVKPTINALKFKLAELAGQSSTVGSSR